MLQRERARVYIIKRFIFYSVGAYYVWIDYCYNSDLDWLGRIQEGWVFNRCIMTEFLVLWPVTLLTLWTAIWSTLAPATFWKVFVFLRFQVTEWASSKVHFNTAKDLVKLIRPRLFQDTIHEWARRRIVWCFLGRSCILLYTLKILIWWYSSLSYGMKDFSRSFGKKGKIARFSIPTNNNITRVSNEYSLTPIVESVVANQRCWAPVVKSYKDSIRTVWVCLALFRNNSCASYPGS